MKGRKLLISGAALTLVFGLGACNQSIEDLFSEEDFLSDVDEDILASNPTELVELAYNSGNYSIEIEWDYRVSKDIISYDDYQAAISGDEDALEEYYALYDNLYISTSYIFNIYYDVDYIYFEENYLIGDYYYLVYIEMFLNTEEGLWAYFTEDGESWGYISPTAFAINYNGAKTWEEVYGSLFKAYDEELANHLVYNDEYEIYDFDDWIYQNQFGYLSTSSAEWFCDLGGELLFNENAYEYAFYDYSHYGTYFDKLTQKLTSLYYYGSIVFTDRTYTSLCYSEEDLYMTVFDVGNTDKRSVVEFYHEGLQDLING